MATNPRHLFGPIQYGRRRRRGIRVFERPNEVLPDNLPKKMAERIADCMPLALRSVGDAIRHDSENRTKEAYCQYLSSMMYISQVLKDDAWDKDLRQLYNSDTAKLFRLLQQCQERALTIVSTLANDASSILTEADKSTQHLQPPSDSIQRRYSDSSEADGRHSDQSRLPPQSRSSHELSDTTASGSKLSTPSNDDYLHLPSPPGSPMPRHRRTGSYDPLEKAYQENKNVLVAYRTRMQSSTKGRRNQDVISKNLSLMRRMSENLVIAKAREDAIKKKLLERQQRLQEETNKRFGPALLYTREEQEQRSLYTKILEFEQETVWPKHLREKLKLMPTDTKLIKDIITKIFCSTDHPLTQFLFQYQYHVYRKLAPLVKDVGFKDVKSGHKATCEGTDITSSETQPEQIPAETIETGHVETDKMETTEVNTGSLRATDGGENLATELDTDENSRATLQQDESEIGKYLADENIGEEHKGDKNDAIHVYNEGKSLNTDLKKLKSFLDNGASPEGPSEDGQLSDSKASLTVEGTDESENLKSYFEELEDDMFDWESNEDDDVEETTDVIKESHEIASEENICENKEASDTQIQVDKSDDRVEPTPLKDEKSSSELDSLVTEEKDNLSDKVDEEETHGSDEALRKNETEPDNVDSDRNDQPESNASALDANQVVSSMDNENDTRGSGQNVSRNGNEIETQNGGVDQSNQLTYNSNKSDSNHCISNPGEQGRQGQTICSDVRDEEETIQTEPLTDDTIGSSEAAPKALSTAETPHEESEDSKEIDSQGDAQMPKLSLVEESDGEIKSGPVLMETFPQADEVRKQLKDILLDVRFFLEKLQKLLVLAYAPLDTPAGRDLCYSCVEFPFFKPLWPMLLAVLRQVNFEKEVCLADVMAANISKGPFDMGVPQRLCMEDQEVLNSTENKYPYQMAVEELHKLVTMFCPLEKLECLVRTSRCICQCVEDYWESKGKPRHSPETAIGCDDLLPILSFVIIRSGMAQLVSECDAMEEFIPEGYLMGEEGYCLTTLVTALAYLATLKPT